MIHASTLIQEFLKVKRFAMIGVSRDSNDFSRKLYQEFCLRGYTIVPVNPRITIIDGDRCFPRIQDVTPPVSSALLMVPKSSTEQVLIDCAEAGISNIWIYGISGERSVDSSILQFCEERGIKLIAGYCPYMFLPNAAFFHRLHGIVWKMIGKYPT